jgi:cell division control protein 7
MHEAHASLLRQAEHMERHADADHHNDEHECEQLHSELGESMDPLDESGRTVDSSDEEVDDAVAEDMSRFEESFAGITKRFRLINRIGEGEFSTTALPCTGPRGEAYMAARHLLDRLQGRRPGV